MARTVAGSFLTKQQAAVNTPEITLVFKDTNQTMQDRDYSSRLMGLEHRESQFSESATIILDNHDGGVMDICGYFVEIGYGYVDETASYGGRLFILRQTYTSLMGKVVTILELEGVWAIFNNRQITMGTAPLHTNCYNFAGAAGDEIRTIEELVGLILTNVMDGTQKLSMTVTNTDADTRFTTIEPENFTLNHQPFECAADVIRVLMSMTYSFLRTKKGTNDTTLVMDAYAPPDILDHSTSYTYTLGQYVEPSTFNNYHYECTTAGTTGGTAPNWGTTPGGTTSDGTVVWTCREVAEIYNTTTTPAFYEYRCTETAIIPNWVYAFGNEDDDGYGNYTEGSFGSLYERARFMLMPEIVLLGRMDNTNDKAQNSAAAIYYHYASENPTGSLLIPHDARLELFDLIIANDTRTGGSGHGTGKTRHMITGLIHKWKPGEYTLECALGGLYDTFFKTSPPVEIITPVDPEIPSPISPPRPGSYPGGVYDPVMPLAPNKSLDVMGGWMNKPGRSQGQPTIQNQYDWLMAQETARRDAEFGSNDRPHYTESDVVKRDPGESLISWGLRIVKDITRRKGEG